MKWEPIAAMIALFVLGLWLVYRPAPAMIDGPIRDGAITEVVRIGQVRGAVEILHEQGQPTTFRLLFKDGTATEVLTREQLGLVIPTRFIDQIESRSGNALFRLFNITSWMSFIWIAVGFAGQIAFFGRMAIQWIASERQRQSVVPPMFWYLSLLGGIALFTYFVWRQDIIGVLGQTTGVVIYARNIRLIRKNNRRQMHRSNQSPDKA